MKKVISLLLVSVMAITLFGCSGANSKQGSVAEESASSSVEKTVSKDLPDGRYNDVGKGKMYISTPSGTSKKGNVPVIYAGEDELDQIGLTTESLNGKNLSYIYVDGMKNSTDQLADTQTSISLQGDALKVGKHKVEVVQYKNDKTKEKITVYKSASYEVKSK